MNAPFVIQAGLPVEFYEPGDFFRILASAGPVDVRFYRQGVEVGEALQVTEGYAERWRGLGFDRFIIASGTTQTLQVVARLGSDVYFDAPPVGSTDIVSSVPLDLTTATRDALKRPHAMTAWSNNAALAANTPLTIFAPGANVNGAIIWHANAYDASGAGAIIQTVLAKSGAAPTSYTDGEVVAVSKTDAFISAGYAGFMSMERPVQIAAGLGLYFISSIAGAINPRIVRYTLL